MKGTRRRIAVVVPLALAWALGLGASTSVADADAATVIELGWWRSVGVSEPPEGGFAVAESLGDPTSVAALRIAVAGDRPALATLTLTESDGLGADTAALQMCPTSDTWESVSGGSMEDAPAPACDRGSVVLARDDNGVWSGNVASLLDGASVSLMVVPAESESEDPLTGADAGFDLAFEPPVLVAPASSTDDEGAGDAPSPPAQQTFPAPEPAPSEPSPTGSSDPNPPFSAAPLDRGEVGLAPTAQAPAEEPSADEQVAIAPSTPLPQRLASTDGGGGRPWGQAVSYSLMAAVIGTGAGVGRWQLRERGILGVTA